MSFLGGFCGAFLGVFVAEIVLSFFDPDAKVFDKFIKKEQSDEDY